MNRESLAKLRLDRRLIQRRGWIDPAELERELASLPDVSAKSTTLGEVEDDEDSAGAPPENPPLA